ncbi:MAG: hypothetical protein AAF387_10675, partial [Pseudomonadota bacterium]
MRVLHLLAVCGVLFGLFRTAPNEFLTENLSLQRGAWFPGGDYRARPAAAPTPEFDIDPNLICPPDKQAWRKNHRIDGVEVQATEDCLPDNPWDVAVAVKGANNVSMGTLHQSLYAPDAVTKSEDRDGDGDPDLIEIRLEV